MKTEKNCVHQFIETAVSDALAFCPSLSVLIRHRHWSASIHVLHIMFNYILQVTRMRKRKNKQQRGRKKEQQHKNYEFSCINNITLYRFRIIPAKKSIKSHETWIKSGWYSYMNTNRMEKWPLCGNFKEYHHRCCEFCERTHLNLENYKHKRRQINKWWCAWNIVKLIYS